MSDITIARPYALAVFELAKETDSLEHWQQTLNTITAICADEHVAPLLSNPLIPAKELAEALSEIAGKSLNQEADHFLQLLAHNKRLPIIATIKHLYEQAWAIHREQRNVQVTSAIALDKKQQEALSNALQQKLKQTMNLDCKTDEQLLAGAIIRVGDAVFDGSLRGKLQQLHQALAG